MFQRRGIVAFDDACHQLPRLPVYDAGDYPHGAR
jgi:hypothetical protein